MPKSYIAKESSWLCKLRQQRKIPENEKEMQFNEYTRNPEIIE